MLPGQFGRHAGVVDPVLDGLQHLVAKASKCPDGAVSFFPRARVLGLNLPIRSRSQLEEDGSPIPAESQVDALRPGGKSFEKGAYGRSGGRSLNGGLNCVIQFEDSTAGLFEQAPASVGKDMGDLIPLKLQIQKSVSAETEPVVLVILAYVSRIEVQV